MPLDTDDVVRILTDINVGYQVDRLNPTYTVLLRNGGSIDRCYPRDDWQVLSLDRHFSKFVSNEQERREAIQELVERDGA